MRKLFKTKKIFAVLLTLSLVLSIAVIFASAADDTNLALNKSASASSQVSSYLSADAAFNGSTNNQCWAPLMTDTEAWLQVDLGSVMKVNKVEFFFYRGVQNYKILVSENGIDFTEVLNITDGKTINDRYWQDYTFIPINARYVRFQQLSQRINDTNQAYGNDNIGKMGGVNINEMYVYYNSSEALKSVISKTEEIVNDLNTYYETNDTVTNVSTALNAAKALSASATPEEREAAIANIENAIDAVNYSLKSIAIGKSNSASSVHDAWNSDIAFDGKNNFSGWAPALDDENAWLQVDLGSVVKINKVEFYFYSEVQNYRVLVSEDGVNYTEVVNVTNGSTDRTHPWKPYTFETVDARYVKFEQLSQRTVLDDRHYGADNVGKSCGAVISEFYVYYDSIADLSSAISAAEAISGSAHASTKYTAETLSALRSAISSARAVSFDTFATVKDRSKAVHNIEKATEGLFAARPELDRPTASYTASSVNGSFGADKPFDMGSGYASRWEASSSDTSPWLQVDLGYVNKINKIALYFYRGTESYRILASVDGTSYKEIVNVTGGQSDNKPYWKTLELTTVSARYIKFEQLSQRTDASADQLNCGIIAMEIFAVDENAVLSELLGSVKDTAPAVDYENGKLILPELSNKNYEVKLHGSSNKAVITLDGSVYQPLTDTEVTLMYKVVSKSDPASFIAAKSEVSVGVDGIYTAESGDNECPEIIPGIREWKGSRDLFKLDGNGSLIYRNGTLSRTVQIIEGQLSTVLGISIKSETALREAEHGEVVFELAEGRYNELGDEGYYMEIGDSITVTAATEKGILYGGMTLVQMLNASGDLTVPKGIIRDYPQYPVRSISIDVARIWIPIDYLTEITKYLSLYKVNEIHVHISDMGGELSYIPYSSTYFNRSTLRLESKKYPAANSVPGEYYTQDEYRAYQKDVADFGVKVVTEIDTPAHCGWINYINGDHMVNNAQMDLNSAAAREFIKDLLSEFLTGDDPVIVSDTFGIGCDEYTAADDPIAFVSYMNEIGQYVNSLGYKARFWSSNSTGEYTSELDIDADINMWAYNENAHFLDTDLGFINNDGPALYIVPGEASKSFPDRIDLGALYESWEANIFDSKNSVPSQIIPISDPRMLGSEAAIWYDDKVGASEFDYFDRIFDQIILMSEKNWYGTRTEGQSAENFLGRVEKAPKKGFEADPARRVSSSGKELVNIDFESTDGNIALDASKNGYDAVLNGVTTALENGNNYAVLNGGGISLPFASVGFPYSVSFDIYVESETSEKALLFGGEDGAMYINYDGFGRIGYERHGYEYIFDTVIPFDQWVNVQLLCDDRDLCLIVNGANVSYAAYTANVLAGKQFMSTFVLPTEEIGSGVRGRLDNIIINQISDDDGVVNITWIGDDGSEIGKTHFVPGSYPAMPEMQNKVMANNLIFDLGVVWYNGNAPISDLSGLSAGDHTITARMERKVIKDDGLLFNIDLSARMLATLYIPTTYFDENGNEKTVTVKYIDANGNEVSLNGVQGALLLDTSVNTSQTEYTKYKYSSLVDFVSAADTGYKMKHTLVFIIDGERIEHTVEAFSVSEYLNAVLDGNYDMSTKRLAVNVARYLDEAQRLSNDAGEYYSEYSAIWQSGEYKELCINTASSEFINALRADKKDETAGLSCAVKGAGYLMAWSHVPYFAITPLDDNGVISVKYSMHGFADHMYDIEKTLPYDPADGLDPAYDNALKTGLYVDINDNIPAYFMRNDMTITVEYRDAIGDVKTVNGAYNMAAYIVSLIDKLEADPASADAEGLTAEIELMKSLYAYSMASTDYMTSDPGTVYTPSALD